MRARRGGARRRCLLELEQQRHHLQRERWRRRQSGLGADRQRRGRRRRLGRFGRRGRFRRLRRRRWSELPAEQRHRARRHHRAGEPHVRRVLRQVLHRRRRLEPDVHRAAPRAARPRPRRSRAARPRSCSTTPTNAAYDPDHYASLRARRDRRRHDGHVRHRRTSCSDPSNFAIATDARRQDLPRLRGAATPSPTATSSRSRASRRRTTCTSRVAKEVFIDNAFEPDADRQPVLASRPTEPAYHRTGHDRRAAAGGRQDGGLVRRGLRRR